MKFSRLIYFLFLLMAACSSENDPPLPPVPGDDFIRGADLSFLPEIESSAVEFYDTSGTVKDMLTILAEAGCNTVRLRLWHTPLSGHSGLQEVKAFSQRIKAAGLKVFLTIHYSDT